MSHFQQQKVHKAEKRALVQLPCLHRLTFGFTLSYVKGIFVNKAFILVIILVSLVT